jgi:hypothetical protein
MLGVQSFLSDSDLQSCPSNYVSTKLSNLSNASPKSVKKHPKG